MSSTSTKVIAIRISKDTYHRLLVRATKQSKSIGMYIRDFLEYDLYRKSHKTLPDSTE